MRFAPRQDIYWMQSPNGRILPCTPREAQQLQDDDGWVWAEDENQGRGGEDANREAR